MSTYTSTLADSTSKTSKENLCHHCGKPNPLHPREVDGHRFCCDGCATVYDILDKAQLCGYYDIENEKRERPADTSSLQKRFAYLSDPDILKEVAQIYSPTLASITLHIPAMHCAACLWLLENLNRLEPAVSRSRVDFVRKELSLDWDPSRVSLQAIVMLLSRIGYEPLIERKASQAAVEGHRRYMRGLVTRIGVTGFCAGNIMLFSFPDYLGLGGEPYLEPIFLTAKILLSIPVVFYGASEYLKGAWQALRYRQVSLDIPLALGILTLFIRSLTDTFFASGPGFYDSLAGLVLFLLFGRWVQARSFDHLRFDQTLDDFFPLAATVITEEGTRFQKADTLQPGQVVEVQSGMLFPADGALLQGPALIDYSFATGESHPVLVQAGEHVFAGGRLQGKAVQVAVEKPLSRSRFTRLWSHKSFDKKTMPSFVRQVERYFVTGFNWIALGLAAAAGLYWAFHQPDLAWPAATAVLIVACPCALSLALPFATHAAMQRLARSGVFLRKPDMLQELAGLQAIVFDKTGTLTETASLSSKWHGEPLTLLQASVMAWMARQSAHPLAKTIAGNLPLPLDGVLPHAFEEYAGKGLQAVFATETYRLGNKAFAEGTSATDPQPQSSRTYFSRDGHLLGYFEFQHRLRPGMDDMFQELEVLGLEKAVLSGDAAAEGPAMQRLIGSGTVRMACTPMQKLQYLEEQGIQGRRTAMVGDGMNDAGAFAAAEIGVAVREDQSHFSPACDVIVDADRVRHIPQVIRYARSVMRGVVIAFGISLVFNAIALSFAVTGQLSAAIAALLMPLGSITVVLSSIWLTRMASRRFEQSLAS